MTNSSPVSTHRRSFLVMVNEDGAPRGIGVPSDASQWEGQPFQTTHPRKTVHDERLPPEQVRDPEQGDRLYIWINQTGGGRGLTATAEVAAPVEPLGDGLGIRPQNVTLVPAGFLNNAVADRLRRPGNVFADIRQSTVSQLRWLSEEHAAELVASISAPSSPNRSAEAAGAPASPPSWPEPDSASIAAGRQAVMRLIEQRANQGRFRDAIIARDGRRCVVTGSRVPEVLEAAHLIPYASGDPQRDDPSNGILLKADIHLLFDRGLMAINPDTMTLSLSPRLQNTRYSGLAEHGRVRTSAGVPFLRWHYDEFIKNTHLQ